MRKNYLREVFLKKANHPVLVDKCLFRSISN